MIRWFGYFWRQIVIDHLMPCVDIGALFRSLKRRRRLVFVQGINRPVQHRRGDRKHERAETHLESGRSGNGFTPSQFNVGNGRLTAIMPQTRL